MKTIVWLTILLQILSGCSKIRDKIYSRSADIFILDYENKLRNLEESNLLINTNSSQEKAVNEALYAGKKNLVYLDKLNESRNENNKIQFLNNFADSFGDYDSHWSYGAPLIEKKIEELRTKMSGEFSNIFFGKISFSNMKIIDKNFQKFIKWSREIDRLAKHAIRWRTVIYPHQAEYALKAGKDVRSFLFLKNYGLHQRTDNGDFRILSDDLKQYVQLEEKIRNFIRKHLIGICLNSQENLTSCENKFDQSLQDNELENYYQTYLANAQKTYDSYFKLNRTKHEIFIDDDGKISIYFQETSDILFYRIFQEAIEEIWGIAIAPSNAENDPQIVRMGEIIPHVNFDRNTIFWNDNIDLKTPYGKRVMAHEFGHIIGFNDCYVEFLDTEKNQAVFYFLDRSNIMCNSSAFVQKQHIEQLKETLQ